MDGEEIPSMGVSELRIGDGSMDPKGKEARAAAPQKEPTPAPPAPVKRTTLGRQFGRLGGAVAGKGRRNQ